MRREANRELVEHMEADRKTGGSTPPVTAPPGENAERGSTPSVPASVPNPSAQETASKPARPAGES